MLKSLRRIWKYVGAAIGMRFDEMADPKVQLTQAIEESQDQHRKLKQQAANVIANQKQTEMRLNRVMAELEKTTESARQAIVLADRAQSEGDSDKVSDYTRIAESLATKLITLEDEAASLKTLHNQTTQAADQARAAVQNNSLALQKKINERQKLLNQLDQAKMQEQVNAAMASLTEKIGSENDTPTLDAVRDKIEARYAKALGEAALADSDIEVKMLQLERETMNLEAQARLDTIRQQLGLPIGNNAQAVIDLRGHDNEDVEAEAIEQAPQDSKN